MITNDHCGISGGQKSGSALVEKASGHSESAGEPYGPRSGPKTARGQRGSMKGPDESAPRPRMVRGARVRLARPGTRSIRPRAGTTSPIPGLSVT